MSTPQGVGVFSFGRKQSERCPNKMLRPFADTTSRRMVPIFSRNVPVQTRDG